MGDSGRKHLKKKKRAAGSRMLLAFGVIVLLYFALQLLSSLWNGVDTVSATRVTLDDTLTVTGWFIRTEGMVEGPSSQTVEHVVHSGEKVRIGTKLAVEYADAEALQLSRELQSCTSQLDLLQSVLDASGDSIDTGKLDQLITIQMQSLAAQTEEGMFSSLESSSSELRRLILRRGAGGQDEATLKTEIDGLKQQQASLKQRMGTRTNVIASPYNGYFSDTVDGYEGTLTPADIDALTVETMQQKLTVQPQPETGALGKVIQGFHWYLAAIVPNQAAESLHEGQKVSLRFAQMSEDVAASVYAVRPGGAQTLILFESSVISSELVSMRQQIVDVVKGTYTGIKIPKAAIRMDGEQMGVYTLSGSVSNFKPVKPLYEGDTFYVVEQSKNDMSSIVVQDDIIVKARGLEDKKVVK